MKFSNHVKTNNKPNCNYHSATLCCILSYVIHVADIRRFIFFNQLLCHFQFHYRDVHIFFSLLRIPATDAEHVL